MNHVAITRLGTILVALLSLTGCSVPQPTEPQADAAWHDLFDGSSLAGWQPTNFGGEGEVVLRDGAMHLDFGSPMTGMTLTGDPPTGCYELEVTAARIEGVDFFCGLTFPVGDSHLSLILGGWGGSTCGLSNIDGNDASNNETRTVRGFELQRDYLVRIEVHLDRVEATVDGEPFCSTTREDVELSLRPEVDPCKPLGIASFATRARIRAVRWRPLAN